MPTAHLPPWAIHKKEFLSGPDPFLNRAFLYGESIFTTLTMRRGKFFALKENEQRLQAACQYLYGHSLEDGSEELRENLKFIQAHFKEDVIVRPTFYSPLHSPHGALSPKTKAASLQALFFCSPLTGIENKALPLGLAQETAIGTTPLKGAQLLERLRQVRAQGGKEVLFYDGQGHFTEASTANLFYVRKDRLGTPALGPGVYPGVIRHYLLKLAPQWGMKVEEAPLRLADLGQVQSLFLTNQVQVIRAVPALENGWQEDHNGRECRENLEKLFFKYYDEHAQNP